MMKNLSGKILLHLAKSNKISIISKINEKRAYQFVEKLSEVAGQLLEGNHCEGLSKHKKRIEKMLHNNEKYFDLFRANQILPAMNNMNRAIRLSGMLPYYVKDFVEEVEEFSRNPRYILSDLKTDN